MGMNNQTYNTDNEDVLISQLQNTLNLGQELIQKEYKKNKYINIFYKILLLILFLHICFFAISVLTNPV